MKDIGTKVLEDVSKLDIKVENEEKVTNNVEKDQQEVTSSKSEPEENDGIDQLANSVKALNIKLDDDKDELIERGPTGGVAVSYFTEKNLPISVFGNYTQNFEYAPMPNNNGRRGLENDVQQCGPAPCPKFRRPAPDPQIQMFQPQQERQGGYEFNNLNEPTRGNPFNNLDFQNQVFTCNPVAGSGGKVIVQSPPPNGPSLADALLAEVDSQMPSLMPKQHGTHFTPDLNQLYQMTPTSTREENVLSPTPSVGSVNMRSPIDNRRTSDPQSDSGVESAAESPYSDVAPSPTGSNYSCPPSVESGYGRSPQHEPGFGQTNYPMSPSKYPGMSPNANRVTPSPASSIAYYSSMQQQPQANNFFDDPNTAQILEDAYDIIEKDLNDDKHKNLLTKQPIQSYPPNVPVRPISCNHPANFAPNQHLPKQAIPHNYQPIQQPSIPVQMVPSQIIIPSTVATTTSNQPSFIIVQPNPTTQTSTGPLIVVTQVPKTQAEKPKLPRKILPKVSSSTTSTASSPTNGAKSVCSTSSSNRSNIMTSREGGPAGMRSNQQATLSKIAPEQQNKLLMIARRTVADITQEELLKVDDEGDTILHIAVCKTDKYLVQALLERLYRCNLMAFADHENNKRQTPLYLAVYINQAVMVAMFVKFQVNVNTLAQSLSSDGQTREVKAALHVAASQGHEHMDTLQQLLLAKDISINIVNNYGQTALHCSIATHNRVKGKNKERINSIPVIKMLIKAGADVSAQDQKSGKTPLMYAIEQRDLLLVETILECIEPSKMRNVVRTQAFDGSSCLKIAEGLKDNYNIQAWNKLWNSLQSAASGTVRIQPPVF